MSYLIKENTIKGDCRNKGYTDKISSTSLKPTWWEKDATNYDYCSDGIGGNKRYYRKVKTSSTVTPPPSSTGTTTPPSSSRYHDCGNGPYKIRCSGTPIATVQQCLMNNGHFLKYGADGKFGKYTENALFKAIGKKEFTKDEITTICQKMKPEESLSEPFGKEEQKAYWQGLKDKGLIYSKGIIHLLKNGVTYVYIIKYTKDGTKKVPITREDLTDKTKLIQSFDEFDYVVLSPMNSADKATTGEVGVLTAGVTQNDEVFVKILPDNQGNWKPAESEESFELSGEEPTTESTIKSILKLRLFEQNVIRTIGSSSTPSKSSSVRGGTSGSVSASLTSSSSPSTTSSTTNNCSAIDKGSESLNVKTKEDGTTKKVESGVGVDPEVKSFLESNGYTFDKPGIEEKERLSTKTTVGQQMRNLDSDRIYEEYYSDNTPIWKSSKETLDDLQIMTTIQKIKSAIPKESKRSYCRNAIKVLYQSAFPSTRVVQLKKRSVIDDEKTLNNLKSAIIKCDEEKNFFEGAGGMRDELTALYRCRSNKKGKSYYGVDRYCLTDYKKLKQDNPTMQRESVVKKHMIEAIKNKQKDVMVESILKDIKGLKK